MLGESKDKREVFINTIKSKRLWVAGAVLLAAVIIGAASWRVFFSKSPLQTYLEAEGKNLKKYSQQLTEAHKAFYEDQKPYMESSYKKRMEFTLDITSDSKEPFGIKNAENILDVLRRSKFILDMNSNPELKQSRTKLSLLVEKSPFLDVQAFTKDRKLGFTVPVLLPEEYFTADLDRLDQVYDRFSIPFRPKRIAKAADVAGAVDFSGDKLDEMLKEYGKKLSTVLKDSNVKYGDRTVVKINGKDVNGRQLIINLDSEETKTLAAEIAKSFSSDENFLRLTYENYTGIARIFDEAGFFQVHKVLEDLGYLRLNDILKNYIDNLNVKKDTGAFSKGINTYFTEAAFPEGLKMILVIDASGNILDRKLNTTVLGRNNRKAAIDIHSGTNDVEADSFNKGFANMNITFEDGEQGKRSLGWAIDTNITVNAKEESRKGKLAFNHVRKLNDSEEFAIKAKLDMDSGIDAATLKRNSKTIYDISFTGVDPKLVDRFFGELKNEGWRNNKQKTRNSNSTLTMNFDLPTLELKNTVVKFNLKKEDRLAVDFNLPEVNEQASIDLNNATDDDLSKVREDALKSFGVFYLQNKPIFDALMGQQ